MTVFYGLAMRHGKLSNTLHLIDSTDGVFPPWIARCGAICEWRPTTEFPAKTCPECEARP